MSPVLLFIRHFFKGERIFLVPSYRCLFFFKFLIEIEIFAKKIDTFGEN